MSMPNVKTKCLGQVAERLEEERMVRKLGLKTFLLSKNFTMRGFFRAVFLSFNSNFLCQSVSLNHLN